MALLPNTGVISGSVMGVSINGSQISCETNADFNVDVESLPTSSTVSGRWAESIPGIRSWSIDVNGYLLLVNADADAKTLLNAILTGETMTVQYRTRAGVEAPEVIIEGQCYVQNLGISSPSNNAASWNVTLTGTGPFTVSTEEFWLIINAMPIQADKPVYVDTTEW